MGALLIKSSPRPFTFEIERTALLVIDVQNDFCSPGGYMEHAGADVSILRRPVHSIREVLAAARRVGMHVIFTREGHPPGLETVPPSFMERTSFAGHPIGKRGPLGRLLVRGEKGHDIVDELKPWPNETIIDKPGKGAFYATELETILRQRYVTHLVFTGLTTNCCVEGTIREANDRGFRNLILTDCVAASSDELHTNALRGMTYLGGLFAVAATSEDVIGALAGAPQSRAGRRSEG
jgi:nicotinamidase-related amidase